MKKAPVINSALILIIGVISVSTASIFIRFAQTDVPSLIIAVYRMAFATILLIPFSLKTIKQERQKLSRSHIVLMILTGFFLALHFASWITSLEFTTVASSVVLVTSTPLWVSLISPLVLKERISLRIILGLLIALGGTLLISISGNCEWIGLIPTCSRLTFLFSERGYLGNLMALCGAFFFAGHVIIGRTIRRTLSLASYTFSAYGIAAVFLIVIAIVKGEPLFGYSIAAYFLFFLLALIPQVIGHSCFNWALGYLPAIYVSIALLGEPIGSSLLAWFILGEKPVNEEITGGCLILVGILVASLRIQSKRNN
ncbi:MAG TPA: DMT family transporter [Anaerolineae bacterium]|nr:DMT family transporter [Anaerolineae bacterium]